MGGWLDGWVVGWSDGWMGSSIGDYSSPSAHTRNTVELLLLMLIPPIPHHLHLTARLLPIRRRPSCFLFHQSGADGRTVLLPICRLRQQHHQEDPGERRNPSDYCWLLPSLGRRIVLCSAPEIIHRSLATSRRFNENAAVCHPR